jgi:hypothetical protein
MPPKEPREVCPSCGMNMVVVAGRNLDPEKRTYECLRCGHRLIPGQRAHLPSTGAE